MIAHETHSTSIATSNSTINNSKFNSRIHDNLNYDIQMSHNLMKDMKSAAFSASQLLKSLSHPDRLMLLCQLTQGEYCVSDLEEMVGLGQPSLSQQLGILRKENLVHTRREGKQIYYSLASEDAKALLQLLYERFCP